MNRLWIRFGLAFGIMALLGPILLGTLGILTVQSGVLNLLMRNELIASGSLSDQLVEYYQDHQGWDGVEDLLRRYDDLLPRGPEGTGLSLVFADEGRHVLYGTPSSDNAQENSQNISIVVDGRTRGYLGIVTIHSFEAGNAAQNPPFLVNQISRVLLTMAVIIAVPGLVAGIIMARMMATPLSHLAETARRYGRRELDARAEVKGPLEIREVASAFNEMAQELSEAETLRRNLVADVAHELRTPLSVLRANLQALADGIYPLNLDEIEKLSDQTELLNRLVTELRDLSQAEARQLVLRDSVFSANELISRVATNFQATMQQQRLVLIIEMPAKNLVIRGDQGRLEQVLNNLMQNAIVHTPSGGCITLSLHAKADDIVIKVQDTGSGIAAADLPRVFDRFYRADRSRSRETGGSGLGLAIAKAIVELHRGTIEVDSPGVAGQGTTLTIRLPEIASHTADNF